MTRITSNEIRSNIYDMLLAQYGMIRIANTSFDPAHILETMDPDAFSDLITDEENNLIDEGYRVQFQSGDWHGGDTRCICIDCADTLRAEMAGDPELANDPDHRIKDDELREYPEDFEDPYDVPDEDFHDFSRAKCDGCGTRLGGARYTILRNEG